VGLLRFSPMLDDTKLSNDFNFRHFIILLDSIIRLGNEKKLI